MPERIVMVLRLKYFLEIWKLSLRTLGCSEQHFLGRDAEIIFTTLVNGFIGLVFVYREYLDHPNYPFCP